MAEKVRLVSSLGFLESVRFLGLTTVNAVCELIDNSLDAEAKEIHVIVSKKQKEDMLIIVADDGLGIPKKIKNSEGIDVFGIAQALSFGGRIQGTGIKIGRFGWGLSSSAVCQSMRTEVYTKTSGEKQFRFNYIDIEEMAENKDLNLPEDIEKNPANEYQTVKIAENHGTIVVLKKCTNPDNKKQDTMANLLMDEIGEIYRKYIEAGRRIFINGVELDINDPLYLSPKCRNADKIGYGKLDTEFAHIIDEKILDDNGEPAFITIKMAVLDFETIRRNEQVLGLKRGVLAKKYGLNMENQGFYLCRKSRQIGRAETLGLFTRHNDLNYFRGEIVFPPQLDHYFGIQTNKSRFSLQTELRDQLREKIRGIINRIEHDIEKINDKLNAEGRNLEERESEKTAARVVSLLKSQKLPKEIMEKRQIFHKAIKDVNERLGNAQKLRNESDQLTELKLVFKDLTETVLPKNVKKELENLEESDAPINERLTRTREIINRFQFNRPYKIIMGAVDEGLFYDIVPKAEQTEIVINIRHPFYRAVYEKASQDYELQSVIELMLITLAHAEYQYVDQEEVSKFYRTQKREWSTILATLCENIDNIPIR